MKLSPELEQYIQLHSSPELPVLHEIYRKTNLSMVNPRMVSGHIQGLFLTFLAQLCKAKKILEIGTYTAYSAICMAHGMVEDGILHTIEVNDEIAEFARENIALAKMEQKIHLHVGSAMKIIPALQENNFDIIFIDGEKKEYPAYFKICKDLVRPGGILIADNVLWDYKVINPEAFDEAATKAVMDFNNAIQEDEGFENMLLPIRDGIMIARKLG